VNALDVAAEEEKHSRSKAGSADNIIAVTILLIKQYDITGHVNNLLLPGSNVKVVDAESMGSELAADRGGEWINMRPELKISLFFCKKGVFL